MLPDPCESIVGVSGAASGVADIVLTKTSLSTAVHVMMRATQILQTNTPDTPRPRLSASKGLLTTVQGFKR